MKIRFGEEQIVRIFRESDKPGNREAMCRKYGITDQTYYRWKRKYQSVNVLNVRRLKELERENGRLKKLVAEQAMEHQVLRDELQKRGSSGLCVLVSGGISSHQFVA